MKNLSLILAVPIALSGALGVAGGDETVARAIQTGLSLDLSPVWEIASVDDPGLKDLRYSAKGWDETERDLGLTVRLVAQYGSLADGVFVPSTQQDAFYLTDWKSDRGICTWTPSESMFRGVYCLRQETSGTQPYAQAEKLQAYFSFAGCTGLRPTDELLLSAVHAGDVPYLVSADLGWWLIGGAGEGVKADAASEFRFDLAGSGVLSFGYRLEAGASLAVFVDGISAGILTATDGWTETSVSVSDDGGDGTHVVELRFVTTGDACAFMRKASYRQDSVSVLTRATVAGCFFDIIPTNGWHDVTSHKETVVWQYSCTNWTGVTGATASSTVRITIYPLSPVGLSPEDRKDYWQWTPGAAVDTQTFEGEGEIAWKPTSGVWRICKEILTGTAVKHREDAIYDVRFPGFLLMLR